MAEELVFDIFDLKSVDKVSKKFLANGGISKQLERAIDDALDEIMHRAVIRMREIMATYATRDGNLAGSNLASSIREERIDDGFIITVDSDHALYVEFGTGIVGKRSPHPKADMSQYDKGGYGEVGWFYIGKDGKRHWTMGMPSRPYMHHTYLYVRRIMTKTINRHLAKVLK